LIYFVIPPQMGENTATLTRIPASGATQETGFAHFIFRIVRG
jgi:hypothetical protein